MKIFITGVTGLIGHYLAQKLLRETSHEVYGLSRSPLASDRYGAEYSSRFKPILGNPTVAGDWLDPLRDCHVVVHLAGESITASRWSGPFIERMRQSRVNSTRLIAETLAEQPKHVEGHDRVLISASAVGYYGDQQDRLLEENASPGNDIMARLCVEWEAAADPARLAGVRVAHPRIGIVLARQGGALPKMAFPFRLFLGGKIGSGKQFVPWIHIEDMARALIFAWETPEFSGPFNATAPNPVTNQDMSKILGRALGRPSWLPVPIFALRIIMGKVAHFLAGGQRTVPQALRQRGFTFQFDKLESALKDLLETAPS